MFHVLTRFSRPQEKELLFRASRRKGRAQELSGTILALAAAALCCAALPAADPLGWIRPANFSDPENKWSDEPRGYDGSTTTYAIDKSNRSGNGAWLEFSSLSQSLVRVSASTPTSSTPSRIMWRSRFFRQAQQPGLLFSKDPLPMRSTRKSPSLRKK